MKKAILATKVGMTQIFNEDGGQHGDRFHRNAFLRKLK